MASKFGTWWQKIRKSLVIIAIIAFLVGGLVWLILPGYRVTWTGFSAKTLWDWMQLLLVPLMLAIGGFWLNQIQKSRDERATEQRDKTEREITLDKQREDLLQTYLDRMSELLLEKQLHPLVSPYDPYEIRNITRDEVRNVARVRTITILFQLDARRIGYVFAFLREAGLMSNKSDSSIVSLSEAPLSKVNWNRAILREANLSGAKLWEANLSDADLAFANLSGADLASANLGGALLAYANLSSAELSRANLSSSNESHCVPNLSNANLSGAKLWEANLWGAYLAYANLSGAELSFADFRGAELSRANLEGATLNEANLRDAHLREANLRKANLRKANLRKANLRKANLSGAWLWKADFREAELHGADLREVILDGTILGGARYNTEELVIKDSQGQIIDQFPSTQWPQGFNPKAAGAIEDNILLSDIYVCPLMPAW